MRLIIKHGVTQWDLEKRLPELSLEPDTADYVRFILGGFKFEEAGLIPEYYFSGTFFLGFSLFSTLGLQHTSAASAELGHVLRALCDVVDEASLVQLDYSSLIEWGTYLEDDDITETPEGTVLLTEGSSDRLILERTLRLRHPDLAKYFTFLDFHLPNLQGGASSLVHMLKGFIAAGIRNRMVAIFDNDTATWDALRSLREVPLPSNMRVLVLPDLEIARHYPTLGPQGRIPVDINGQACSLELFLGKDVLSSDDGTLIPVQWKGYNNALQRYYGELQRKAEVQGKYMSLLDSIEARRSASTDHDWSAMESLLAEMFSAFCRQPNVPGA